MAPSLAGVDGTAARRRPRRGLELFHVDRLGPLRTLLLLKGDLAPLGQRAVTVSVDAGVVDEQVASAFVRGDEPKALLVVEPLDGSSWHEMSSLVVVLLPPRTSVPITPWPAVHLCRQGGPDGPKAAP